MQPSAQQPGQKIDQELNASLTSTNQTISRLNEIQRDDGKLRTSALDLTELTTIAVPPGGTTGQVLAKTSNVSYATAWTTLSLTQYVEKANNLSDLANVATARANLGLGTMATQSASNYALLDSPALTGNPTSVTPATSDNDTSIATTAFVKAQGLVPVGGTAGQFLTKTTTGVDYATDWTTVNLSVYAVKANNLSDLTSASTARTNLGLGTMAIETASNYALLNAPIFTGDARAVTAALADNDTSIATTAFVQQELASGTANARNLEVYARNQTGSTIPIGSIVYINGATGNRPTITLAQANNDANSAQTIGFTKTAIANNGFGFVIIRGELENLDTSALTEGVQLYLSPTTAGTWTTTKPSAPQHLVYVGIVIRSHPTLGTILVSVQNGYEVAELHDSAISGLANNDLFAYESSTDLWKNKSFSALGLAPLASPTFSGTPSLPTGTTGITQSAGDNSTKLATTAFVANSNLNANFWAPGVNGLSSLISGTGANAGSSYTAMSGSLFTPNAGVAGYATRGFTLNFPSNSASSAYNYGTPSGHAVKVYSASWASVIAGVKVRGVFGRMGGSVPVPSTLAGRGYGWEWDWATRTMNIIAHNGTALTTTAVTWNPANGRNYEITCTSNGAGTISLFVDNVLLGTTSGGPISSFSSSIVWWQLECESVVTSAAQVSVVYQNPKVITTNG